MASAGTAGLRNFCHIFSEKGLIPSGGWRKSRSTVGAWPSGKASVFGTVYRRFESYRPSQFSSKTVTFAEDWNLSGSTWCDVRRRLEPFRFYLASCSGKTGIF